MRIFTNRHFSRKGHSTIRSDSFAIEYASRTCQMTPLLDALSTGPSAITMQRPYCLAVLCSPYGACTVHALVSTLFQVEGPSRNDIVSMLLSPNLLRKSSSTTSHMHSYRALCFTGWQSSFRTRLPGPNFLPGTPVFTSSTIRLKPELAFIHSLRGSGCIHWRIRSRSRTCPVPCHSRRHSSISPRLSRNFDSQLPKSGTGGIDDGGDSFDSEDT